MSLYLNPRYGFSALTSMNHDDADVLVSKTNAFLAAKRRPGGPVVVLGYDSLDDNNFLYLGLDLGYSKCVPGYKYLDLLDLVDVFSDVVQHESLLLKHMMEVVEQNPTLKVLDWTSAPRKFFSSHS
jgi:hypothetical protein